MSIYDRKFIASSKLFWGYTKIYDIVNNTKKIVTPKFKAAFEAEYNPISYSNKKGQGLKS